MKTPGQTGQPRILLMLALLSLSIPANCGETGEPAVHAHHHPAAQTKHQLADYKLPQIQLTRDDGTQVSLVEEVNDGRPVILNFIYTTCTTICPLASHTFAELQDKLGSECGRVHMLSISIDPEQDTPAVLAKYAGKYEAGNQWHFYTGTKDASIAAQMAFNVYRGDKMNSDPVTFMRAAPGKPWIRIDGFAKSDELLHLLAEMGIAAEVRHAADGD